MKIEQDCDSFNSDIWLSNWAKPEESFKQEENIKQEVLAIQHENNVSATSKKNITSDNIRSKDNENQESIKVPFEKNNKKQSVKSAVSSIKKTSRFKKDQTDSTKSRVFWQEAIEKATVSDTIGNRCKYQCPKCGKNYTAKSSFRAHLNTTKHAVGWDNINDFLTDIVAFKCHICQKTLVCDKSVIYSHANSKHKFNLFWNI